MKSLVTFWAFFCRVLITVPVIGFLIFLTIANRELNVSLIWSPLHDAQLLSLPVIIFASVISGFIWGSLILWSNTLSMKEEARMNRKRITQLEAQIDLQGVEYEKLKGRVAAAEQPIPSSAPRLGGSDIVV